MAKTLFNIDGEVTKEEYEQVCLDCAKQTLLKPKYKLPTFDCPVCGAKKILFAGDRVSKNETVLEMYREQGYADYVIICPKCKQYIAVRRQAGKQPADAHFRTMGGKSLIYSTVFNNRIRGIYRKRPEHELIFEGEYDDGSSAEEPSRHVVTYYYPNQQWYRYRRRQRYRKYRETE